LKKRIILLALSAPILALFTGCDYPCVGGIYDGVGLPQPNGDGTTPGEKPFTAEIRQATKSNGSCQEELTGTFKVASSITLEGKITGYVTKGVTDNVCTLHITTVFETGASGTTESVIVMERNDNGKWQSVDGTFTSDWGAQGTCTLIQR